MVWINPEIRQPTMTTVTAARHVTASGLRDPSPKVKKINATKPTTTLAPICIAVTAASSCRRGSEAIMVMAFPLDLVGVEMQLSFYNTGVAEPLIAIQPADFWPQNIFGV
jgi:hypothetical protein